MNVTVYSKPRCVQCTATYRALGKKGIEPDTIDISVDESAYQYVTGELEHQSAPVVTVTDNQGVLLDHWSGFNPEKINALKG